MCTHFSEFYEKGTVLILQMDKVETTAQKYMKRITTKQLIFIKMCMLCINLAFLQCLLRSFNMNIILDAGQEATTSFISVERRLQ